MLKNLRRMVTVKGWPSKVPSNFLYTSVGDPFALQPCSALKETQRMLLP